MTTTPTYEELEAKARALELELAESKKQDNTIIRLLSEDFKQLADRSQDAIYQFDIESQTFPFFNQQFLSLYAMEENGVKILSPKSVLVHIHPNDREKVKAARTLSLQPQNKIGEAEYRFLNADGSQRVMHDRWTVVRDHGGQPIAIEGFIRDNTWRKQAEKEFERSIRNSLIGCYIVQDATFKYVNPEFMRITGYSEEELIGTDPLNIVQQEYRRQVNENFIKMVKAERIFPYEFCISDKFGNTKWILETATSIQYEGRRAALGYFMDISKGKQVEKERLAKEKLLTALELAGAVGHELNNPLQVVLTCTEKLALVSDDNERSFRLHSLLKKNIEKMRKIIHKFQNITQYATKDYVDGKKIIDIDAASSKTSRK
ncbi:PAS domain S-box protein [Desulfosarcina sp.]|uniref:PAS domain-containing sensor histidine kinase n=1 Tax=Desulfosarcina sp. TaxID=2027861 RepID=UPI0029A09BD8|nr:PAS domain S-box protein [Desulfosarcina sp.]MDX2453545.1 PAS domain S-box protein [Desulfosarcina sp.]MDX2491252.1 PAS domain S-box protein [Desulfosarcina sp.]